MLPRKKPTSHGKGLSSDSGNAVATTFPVRDTFGLTEANRKGPPVKINLDYLNWGRRSFRLNPNPPKERVGSAF